MQYQIGDTIRQQSFGGSRLVLVTGKEEDIKNGRPGFDGTLIGAKDDWVDVWGYDDQVVGVIKKK